MHAANHVAVGDEGAVEKDLGETRLAVEAAHRAHGHPVAAEGHHQIAQPAMPLGLRIAAEQPKQGVAERAARAPGLLPEQAPTAAPLVALGARRDAGQIAARVRLRPALRPHLVGAGHLGRTRAFCSSVPNSNSVGASVTPFCEIRCGAPAR